MISIHNKICHIHSTDLYQVISFVEQWLLNSEFKSSFLAGVIWLKRIGVIT